MVDYSKDMIPVRSGYFKQHMLPSLIQKPGNFATGLESCFQRKFLRQRK